MHVGYGYDGVENFRAEKNKIRKKRTECKWEREAVREKAGDMSKMKMRKMCRTFWARKKIYMQLSEKKWELCETARTKSSRERMSGNFTWISKVSNGLLHVCMISLMITHLHISADANVPLMSTQRSLNTHFLTSLANPTDSKLKGIYCRTFWKSIPLYLMNEICNNPEGETRNSSHRWKGLISEMKSFSQCARENSRKVARCVKAGKTSDKAHDFQWAVKKVVPFLH